MDGDTVILGTTYNKVYYAGCSYPNPWTTVMDPYEFKYGIRQDTTTKRVYAYLEDTGVDTLLYTYGLNVGDTLIQTYTSPHSFYPGTTFTVTYVSSITLNGCSYRKTQFDGSMFDAALIEGVGSPHGLFEQTIGFFEAGWELSNFCRSDMGGFCSTTLSVENGVVLTEDLYYQNPIENELTIWSSGSKISSIRLYDVYGKLIKAKDFQQSGERATMDVSDLPPGLYFASTSKSKAIKIIIAR